MFYLMMGLGFDGYYKRRPSDIIPVMEETAAHIDRGPDFNSEPVTPDVTAGADRERPRGTGYFLTRPAGWILMMSAFLLLSFLVNWAALTGSVSGFLDAAEEASAAAEPYGGSGGSGWRASIGVTSLALSSLPSASARAMASARASGSAV